MASKISGTILEEEESHFNNNSNKIIEKTIHDFVVHNLKRNKTGSKLGDIFCNNEKGADARDPCDGSLGNSMTPTIDTLPIYFLIAHSSMDFELERKNDRSKKMKALNVATEDTFVLEEKAEIESSKFIIYPTPAACWGLLCSDCNDEDSTHILNANTRTLRNALFNPEYRSVQERIENVKTLGLKTGNKAYEVDASENLYPGFFIPGSKVIDKEHEFFGSQLSGDGFGIVKITSTNVENTNKASDLINQWQKQKGDSDGVDDNVYFLTDSERNSKDDELYDLIKQSYTKGIANDSQAGLSMSEIISTGGPGIYISLSCSSLRLFSNILSGSDQNLINITHDTQSNSPYLKLYNEMRGAIDYIYGSNASEWDNLMHRLNYSAKRIPVTGQITPMSSIQVGDDNPDEEPHRRGVELQMSLPPGAVANQTRSASIATLKDIQTRHSLLTTGKGGKRNTKGKRKRITSRRKKTKKRKTKKRKKRRYSRRKPRYKK